MGLTKAQQSNLKQAKTMLENVMRETDVAYQTNLKVDAPYVAADYFRTRIAMKSREVFSVMFLTKQHHFIKADELFLGTIDKAVVHTREIIKEALLCDAAAILIAHNHPSGECKPSEADIKLTKEIKKACDLMDIRLLDHIIVSRKAYYSLAEDTDLHTTQEKLL